jgi:methionyl-tRNA formyltransferase
MTSDYIIYSGPAGVILRDEILNAGKVFIHAHPGLLPEFKGSTTVYYSMLLKREIGCSVFAMNREIDCGEILLMKTFPVPMVPVDFDMVVDPLVRAETLLEWLASEDLTKISNGTGNTFYIIHPVLKHLARIKNLPLQKDIRSEGVDGHA